MSKRARRWERVVALVLLLLGLALYLLYRPQTLVLFRLTDALGASAVIDSWRAAAASWTLPSVVVFCLPGGLWAASYILVMDSLLCGRQMPAVQLMGVSVIPLIGIVSEALQAIHLLPGKADWVDVVCYGVPLLVYLMINAIRKYGKEKVFYR